MKSLANRVNQKLSPHYYGPYEIEKKVGSVAYKPKLPPDCKVHSVFYVSSLKKSLAPAQNFQPLPARLNEEWMLEPVPEAATTVRRNEQGEIEVSIKWQDLPDFESSWEPMEQIKREFPELILEDKDGFEGRGNDRFKNIYVRSKNRGNGVVTEAHQAHRPCNCSVHSALRLAAVTAGSDSSNCRSVACCCCINNVVVCS